jgi:hypothetical protein
VGYLSRCAGRRPDAHRAALRQVLHYINGTPDLGILYLTDDRSMTGCSACLDSHWGSCVTISQCTAGFAFCITKGAVPYSSKVQPGQAELSTKAKYLRLSFASKQAILLSQILGELGYPLAIAPVVSGNNWGAITRARDRVS